MIDKCVHCWNESDSKKLSGIDHLLVGEAANRSTAEATGIHARFCFSSRRDYQLSKNLVGFCNEKYPLKARCICRCHKEVCQTFWEKFWAGELNFLRDEYFSDDASITNSLFLFMRELCEDFFVPHDLHVEGFIDIQGHPLTQDAIVLRGQLAELYTLTHFATGAPMHVDG